MQRNGVTKRMTCSVGGSVNALQMSELLLYTDQKYGMTNQLQQNQPFCPAYLIITHTHRPYTGPADDEWESSTGDEIVQ